MILTFGFHQMRIQYCKVGEVCGHWVLVGATLSHDHMIVMMSQSVEFRMPAFSLYDMLFHCTGVASCRLSDIDIA